MSNFPDKVSKIEQLTPTDDWGNTQLSFQYPSSNAMFREILEKFPAGSSILPEMTIVTTYKNVSIESASETETIVTVRGVSYAAHFTDPEDDGDDNVAPVDTTAIEADRDRAINDAEILKNTNADLVAERDLYKEDSEKSKAELEEVTASLATAQTELETLRAQQDAPVAEAPVVADEPEVVEPVEPIVPEAPVEEPLIPDPEVVAIPDPEVVEEEPTEENTAPNADAAVDEPVVEEQSSEETTSKKKK